MAAYDQYVLTGPGPYDSPLVGTDGVFGIVNLNVGIPITITLHHRHKGGEEVTLSAAGATLQVPLADIDVLRVTAPSYPATVLLLESTIPMILTSPQSFAGTSGGGATVNVEQVGYSGVVKTTVVTVGTTPTPLPATALPNRRILSVQAPSTNTATVYLGGSGVTADTTATGGLEVAPGGSFGDQLGAALLYGIVAAGTQLLIVYEVS